MTDLVKMMKLYREKASPFALETAAVDKGNLAITYKDIENIKTLVNVNNNETKIGNELGWNADLHALNRAELAVKTPEVYIKGRKELIEVEKQESLNVYNDLYNKLISVGYTDKLAHDAALAAAQSMANVAALKIEADYPSNILQSVLSNTAKKTMVAKNLDFV